MLRSSLSLPSALPSVLDAVGNARGNCLVSQPLPVHALSPFIVGQGYAPIPTKTVNAIVMDK
jgi:hypothetical protein